jgi:hypothetical protein
MMHSPQPFPRQRSMRVKLSGSILALVSLDNQRQLRVPLHQLSLNGGLLRLAEPLEAATVELMFHIGSSTLRARAETLFPMWATQGCLQPFRFARLRDQERQMLESNLCSLLGIPRVVKQASSVELEEADVPILDVEEPLEEEQPGPSQVVLYFDNSHDAMHFTLAVSPVIARDVRACTKEDLTKLAHEIGKVNRVTTTGILNRALPSRKHASALQARVH